MTVWALIPARGGSKRIPRKNLERIGGKSLVELAIAAARGAARVDEVWVSTDDVEIMRQTVAAGALFIRRPGPIAADHTSMEAVLEHFVAWNVIDNSDIVVLLEPTAPLRSAADIDLAVALLERSGAPAVRLVAPFDNVGCHPAAYRDAGLACAMRAGIVLRGCLFPSGTVLMHHGEDRALDIDEPADLERARALSR